MKGKWVVFAILLLGLFQIAQGGYLLAKTHLAQVLMLRAWHNGLSGRPSKPWPWADTYPIARLRVPDLEIDQILLSGANGRNMNFGQGYLLSSTRSLVVGNTVLAEHRDAHFTFLAKVRPRTLLKLQWIDGHEGDYMVIETAIVDSRFQSLELESPTETLTLVTGYPFDAITEGGPLRYVVVAEPLRTNKTVAKSNPLKPSMHEQRSCSHKANKSKPKSMILKAA